MSGGLYFSHPSSIGARPAAVHAAAPGHPRAADRARAGALRTRLARLGAARGARRSRRPSSSSSTRRAYVRAVRELCAAGGGNIDPDTAVVAESWPASLHAAGGAVEMARALIAGDAPVAYCGDPALRPPRRTRARDGLLRVRQRRRRRGRRDRRISASRGCSCSTGTSTTATAPPRSSGRAAMCCSRACTSRRCTRGRGPLEDAGSGAGEGYTINLPVPPGTEPELWMELFERVVVPAARAFEPRADPRLLRLRRPSRGPARRLHARDRDVRGDGGADAARWPGSSASGSASCRRAATSRRCWLSASARCCRCWRGRGGGAGGTPPRRGDPLVGRRALALRPLVAASRSPARAGTRS